MDGFPHAYCSSLDLKNITEIFPLDFQCIEILVIGLKHQSFKKLDGVFLVSPNFYSSNNSFLLSSSSNQLLILFKGLIS